jgi:hypothetical protein
MRRNSNRPSVAILIAALALAACQSTPAAPPTQTPINPKDTFATPGAPTPFLPTMTPAPSPTMRPTATAVPPIAVPATVAVPTLAPTKGGTATPTPVIVNGQPKMWWVDQMVKQADGGFMAPEAVRQTIRVMVSDSYRDRIAIDGRDPLTVAKALVAGNAVRAERFYIGDLRQLVINTPSPQIQIVVAGKISVVDIRAFGPDGITAFAAIDFTGIRANVYSASDWSLLKADSPGVDLVEVWKVRLDLADGRWKYESLVTSQKK